MYTMSEERVTLYKKIIRYLLIIFSIDITYVFYITRQLTFPTNDFEKNTKMIGNFLCIAFLLKLYKIKYPYCIYL